MPAKGDSKRKLHERFGSDTRDELFARIHKLEAERDREIAACKVVAAMNDALVAAQKAIEATTRELMTAHEELQGRYDELATRYHQLIVRRQEAQGVRHDVEGAP